MPGTSPIKRLVQDLTPPIFWRGLRVLRQWAGDTLLGPDYIHRLVKGRLAAEPEIERLFPAEKVRRHYVYEAMPDTAEHPDLMITQARYWWMLDFFRRNYPEILKTETRILDVGDTSGILFEAMGRKGASLNINRECVDYLLSRGMEAHCADGETLPFEDGAFDYVFSFQCLEHMPSPLKALSEMRRVAKRRIFVSIPNAAATTVYSRADWEAFQKERWGEHSKAHDTHIIEFSAEDFRKIVSFAGLRCVDDRPIPYWNEETPLGRRLRPMKSYFRFYTLERA
jgi:SAM-dependent methyltransferase